MRARYALVFLTLLFGCATAPRPLDELLQRGNSNVIKAQNDFEDEFLHVTGTVEDVGLKQRETQEVEVTHFGPTSSGELHRVTTVVGQLRLAPAESDLGRLFCTFEPDDRDDLENLQVGQKVTVIGYFRRFRKAPSGLVITMSNCTVDD